MAAHTLTPEFAARLAHAPLAHVTREYPNKLDHVIASADDVGGPRALHPVFYGSFDWHSCVHGWWTLMTLLRLYPTMPPAAEIKALADATFTPANVAGELAYLARPEHRGFERPYGWAWVLMLAAELHRHDGDDAARWRATLAPLVQAFVERFTAFLPHSPYPVRAGVHTNTAFALRLGIEYADTAGDVALGDLFRERAKVWYADDRAAPALEPSQDDFLSSTLIEIECMRVALPADAFREWREGFVRHDAVLSPLLETPAVTDRTDGKIGHLDGLCMSRAWCLRALADTLHADDPRRLLWLAAAAHHLNAAVPHMEDDYMGQHWLATFALLAIADRRLDA